MRACPPPRVIICERGPSEKSKGTKVGHLTYGRVLYIPEVDSLPYGYAGSVFPDEWDGQELRCMGGGGGKEKKKKKLPPPQAFISFHSRELVHKYILRYIHHKAHMIWPSQGGVRFHRSHSAE